MQKCTVGNPIGRPARRTLQCSYKKVIPESAKIIKSNLISKFHSLRVFSPTFPLLPAGRFRISYTSVRILQFPSLLLPDLQLRAAQVTTWPQKHSLLLKQRRIHRRVGNTYKPIWFKYYFGGKTDSKFCGPTRGRVGTAADSYSKDPEFKSRFADRISRLKLQGFPHSLQESSRIIPPIKPPPLPIK
jgi:hypothetical protein